MTLQTYLDREGSATDRLLFSLMDSFFSFEAYKHETKQNDAHNYMPAAYFGVVVQIARLLFEDYSSIKTIKQLQEKFKKNKIKILDLGSGPGLHFPVFEYFGFSVLGVDIDSSNVAHGQKQKRNIILGDFLHLQTNPHDMVLLIHAPTITNIPLLAERLYQYTSQFVITDFVLAQELVKTKKFVMDDRSVKCGFPLGVLKKF